jgi:hypothetical protein
MSDIEYGFEICSGNPCDNALSFVEADYHLTAMLAKLSGAAFEVLDARTKIPSDMPNLRSVFDVHLEENQASYDAISDSRESTREQIAQYCGRCPGLLEGICPGFTAE